MKSRILSYIQFLWHSKNEHGVHSPFVFLFVTKGLYNKNLRLEADALSNRNKSVSRKQQLLYKIVRYFEPKSILTLGATPSEIEIIELGSPNAIINVDAVIYNCIYFGSNSYLEIPNKTIEQLLQSIENNSCWILGDIHANAISEAFWNNLKQNPNVTVTIDTFYFGLVFFRKEQVEEHFIIRA